MLAPQSQSLKERKAAYYYRLHNIQEEIANDQALLRESNIEAAFRDEVQADLLKLQGEQESIVAELKKIAQTERDTKGVERFIIEIRAGTGGEEAALFAGDLLRMYSRYAERKNWHLEVLEKNETSLNGIREAMISIKAKGAYDALKYESGTHRVQRIPLTEKNGRIHTSTASVAVLPEPDEVEVNINPDDLRIDTFHSSGKGGQHVNVTNSAIRIIHLPTNIMVTCQNERSQHKNKEGAMRLLRTKLYERELQNTSHALQRVRREMVGHADRSDKLRTYNFPQDRLTDHRVKKTWHNLPKLLDGDIDELVTTVCKILSNQS